MGGLPAQFPGLPPSHHQPLQPLAFPFPPHLPQDPAMMGCGALPPHPMSTLINGCCVLPGSPPRVLSCGAVVKAGSIWPKGSSASTSPTIFEILRKLCFVFPHPLDPAPPFENPPVTPLLTGQNPNTSDSLQGSAWFGFCSTLKKIFFYFEIILGLQKSCKDNIKNSNICFPSLPLMIASYAIIAHLSKLRS